MNSAKLLEALLSDVLFQQCERADLARLIPYLKIYQLEPGERLFQAGDVATGCALIMEGEFETCTENGEAISISNGLLGGEAAIGMREYLRTTVAQSHANILLIPSKQLQLLSKKNAKLSQHIIDSYSSPRQSDLLAEKSGDPVEKKSVSPFPSIGWLLACIIPLLVFWSLKESPELPSREAVYLLAVISATVVMWVFRLLPDFIPAIFAVLSSILLGLAPAEVALSGFASGAFFMAMSIFGLSVVTTRSGFSYRILLWLLRLGPANKLWYRTSLFLAGVILTPIIPTSNGRVAIVAPVLKDLLNSFGDQACPTERRRLAMSVLCGLSLLSAIFMSSKSINFVVFGFLPLQDQAQFQWVAWFGAAAFTGFVLVVGYLLMVWLMFRNSSHLSISKEMIACQLQILGPMRTAEWGAMLGLLVMLGAVLTVALHGIAVPWITLAILFSLLMFGLLEKECFRSRIDWSFLVYLGALISLVTVIRHVGVDIWFTDQFRWLTGYMQHDFRIFILLLAGAVFVVRLALPINATVVVFATFLIPAAINVGVNPWLIGFLILLLSESFLWPFQASYYLQFSSMLEGSCDLGSVRTVLFQLGLYLLKLLAIYASFPYWRYWGLL